MTEQGEERLVEVFDEIFVLLGQIVERLLRHLDIDEIIIHVDELTRQELFRLRTRLVPLRRTVVINLDETVPLSDPASVENQHNAFTTLPFARESDISGEGNSPDSIVPVAVLLGIFEAQVKSHQTRTTSVRDKMTCVVFCIRSKGISMKDGLCCLRISSVIKNRLTNSFV